MIEEKLYVALCIFVPFFYILLNVYMLLYFTFQ